MRLEVPKCSQATQEDIIFRERVQPIVKRITTASPGNLVFDEWIVASNVSKNALAASLSKTRFRGFPGSFLPSAHLYMASRRSASSNFHQPMSLVAGGRIAIL
jgi:hypothetical protein